VLLPIYLFSVGIDLKVLGVSCRNVWNFAQGLKFKANFHSKRASVDINWGFNPPDNSNPVLVYLLLLTLLLIYWYNYSILCSRFPTLDTWSVFVMRGKDQSTDVRQFRCDSSVSWHLKSILVGDKSAYKFETSVFIRSNDTGKPQSE